MYGAPPPVRRPLALWAGLALCVAGAAAALWGVAVPWSEGIYRDDSGAIIFYRIHGYRYPVGWLVAGWALFMLRVSYLAYRDAGAVGGLLAVLVSISNMLCCFGLIGACYSLENFGEAGLPLVFGASLLLAAGAALLARAAAPPGS
ncbi:MAG TPA: hypothetical protein VGE07_28610 [Herpetosiphonaceae bacterium]